MNDVEFIRVVRDLLRSQSTLALATAGEDGAPQIAPLFYFSTDDLRLYWFSSVSSSHSRNVERNNAAALTVYRATDQWKEIRGVQMRGTVSVVADGGRRGSIEQAYAERFHLGTLFQVALATSNLYVFQPAWIRYLDNSTRVGYKVERTLAEIEAQLGAR